MRITTTSFLTILVASCGMLATPLNAWGQRQDDRRSSNRNFNEDEWYDPTDWFDGNNREYDDMYEDEGRQRNRRNQQRSSDDRQTQRRYSSGASQGNSRSRPGQNYIERYDENNDDQLSRNELPSNMRQTFDQLDRNSDGRVTRSELQQHAGTQQSGAQPVHITYVWVTSANQGQMSLNDLQQAYDLLQQIDDDGNGQISRRELRARRQEIVSNWVDSTFRKHDENDDGQIGRDEAEATAMAQRFDRLDRNSNDRVSREELQRSLEESLLGQSDSSQGRDQNRSQQQRQQSSRGQQRR